ncbi:MAG: hypothetical protein IJP96_10960 [Synergistaceae bacterium]|nr:hypothetical protein [Synergistaceae bacterium]
MSIDLRIAETIFQQLGGKRFVAMTGVHDMHTNGDDLVMSLIRNQSKANRLQIKYNFGSDLYTMRFYRETGGKFNKNYEWIEHKLKEIKTFDEIYFDQLTTIFREFTGLETRMPRVIGINA